ncbi:MAG: transglutaminase family protein [Candidatus Heimdallarchaeota archaeon]|nr:transglutaminase family protein [Candidatus Heimdallarchaeota archaeon]
MKKVTYIAPILIVMLIFSGFYYSYDQENDELVKGETKYQLSYRYFFVNNGPLNLTSVDIRLAQLKSWEPYQRVNDILIHSEPNRTSIDDYSNKFLTYSFENVEPGQTIDLKIDVNLTVNFIDYSSIELPNFQFNTTDSNYVKFMAYDPLTDTTDLRIREVASRLQAKSSDYKSMAFEAYNFTSHYLNYKLLSTSRGASFALSNGYGDCDEYQNLFIALVRAMGIPAIGHTAWFADFYEGMIMSDDGVIAHAFPMFELPGIGLVSADPTRGKDQLYDNWMKTDNKRIIMTQGPDQPYRLLNYRWIPVDGIENPTISRNYTIEIKNMETQYFSKIRTIIVLQLIFIPIIYVVFNLVNFRRTRRIQQEKLVTLLNPERSS